METIVARAETAAEFMSTTADRIEQVAALAERTARLVSSALANPALDGLRHALGFNAVQLAEAAQAVRAQQPNMGMFAAVEAARQGQCASCPLRQRARLAVLPRPRALTPTA